MIARPCAGPALAALLAIAGCAQPSAVTSNQVDRPARPPLEAAPEADPADEAAMHAMAQLGSPYRFGGTTPAGFDCSGLVRYSYGLAGIALPRETGDQRRLAIPVASGEALRPGDLLFFRRGRNGALHVGMYVGHGEFVHAPSSGGEVRIERLEAPHWKQRFIEARRVAPAS